MKAREKAAARPSLGCVNPLPALRTLAWGVRDWAKAAPRLLLVGAPGILTALLVVLAAVEMVPVLEDRLVSAPHFLRVLALAGSVLLFGALFFSAASWVWLAADRAFFSARDWIDNPLACLSVALICLVPLGGLAFLAWIALVALAPRLGGPPQLDPSLLWPPLAMPRAYALVLGGAVLVALPLLVRLCYAPVAAAVERGEAQAAWETIMRLTRGKTPALVFATLPQAALFAAGVAAAMEAVEAEGALSLPLAILAVVLLSLVSSLQVVVLRHFIGSSPGDDAPLARDFEVEDPSSQNVSAADAELPELPEGLRAKEEERRDEGAREGKPSLAEIAASLPVEGAEAGESEQDSIADFFEGISPEGEHSAGQEGEEGEADELPAAEQAPRPERTGPLQDGVKQQAKPRRPSLTEYLDAAREERLSPPAPGALSSQPGQGQPGPSAPPAARPQAPQPPAEKQEDIPKPPSIPGLDDD